MFGGANFLRKLIPGVGADGCTRRWQPTAAMNCLTNGLRVTVLQEAAPNNPITECMG